MRWKITYGKPTTTISRVPATNLGDRVWGFAQQFSRGANALNDLPCSGRVLFCDVTMDDVTMDMVEMPPRATYSAAS
jgi:hypothetical protein